MQHSKYFYVSLTSLLLLLASASGAQTNTIELPEAIASYTDVSIAIGSASFKTQDEGKFVVPIQVTTPGSFVLKFRTKNGSTSAGSFRFTFADRSSVLMNVPVQDYQWITISSEFSLAAGQHQLTLEGVSAGIFFDRVQLTSDDGGIAKAALNLQHMNNNNISNFVSPIDSTPTFTKTITIVPNELPLEDHIINALRQSVPGTKIIIPDGTYINPNLNMERADCPHGLPNKPIVIQAANPGRVVFTGSELGLDLCGSYIVLKGIKFKATSATEPLYDKIIRVGIDESAGVIKPCDYCALRQLYFENFSPLDKFVKSFWVYIPHTKSLTGVPVQSSKFVEISDSVFKNKTNMGPIIYIAMAPISGGHRIYRNYFSRSDLGVDSFGVPLNEGETIRMGDSLSANYDSNSIVESNLFDDASGDYEIISIKSNKNIVRYNTFLQSKGSISIRIGNSNIIEGNYILGGNRPGAGGIRSNGKSNIIIANHIQETNFATVAQFHPITLMAGENKPCVGTVYCPVENSIIMGNYVTRNASQLAINATFNATSRPVLVKNSALNHNIFAAQSLTSAIFKDYANSNFAGLSFFDNYYSGYMPIYSLLNFKAITTNEMQINDDLFYPTSLAALNILKISAEKRSTIINDENILIGVDKNIYDMYLPLSAAEVGKYTLRY